MREGTVALPSAGEDAETWYRVTGELRPGDTSAPAPLVVLHGGPGATHDYLLSLAEEILRRHEAAGTTDDPEYMAAEAFAWIDRDPGDWLAGHD